MPGGNWKIDWATSVSGPLRRRNRLPCPAVSGHNTTIITAISVSLCPSAHISNKAVIDRRLRPRCCHLGSYLKRPKSSPVRPLTCNWYYCAQFVAEPKAACALRFRWAATSSNIGLWAGTLKMRDMKMRETRQYGTPRVAYVCPLPSRNAWVDKKEQIVLSVVLHVNCVALIIYSFRFFRICVFVCCRIWRHKE